MNVIGIRSEQKHWDSRVSLSPDDVEKLGGNFRILIQNDGERQLPFKPRVFSPREYLQAGRAGGVRLRFANTLAAADVIIGTKEIKEVFATPPRDVLDYLKTHAEALAAQVPQFAFDEKLGFAYLADFLTGEEEKRLVGAFANTPAEQLIATLVRQQKKLIEPGKTYVFFSHTHKGQDYNMRMLAQFVRKRATLLDYELLCEQTPEGYRRTVYYSNWAGNIGILETLWTFGEHLYRRAGIDSPFRRIKDPDTYDAVKCEYVSLHALKNKVLSIGRAVADLGTAFPVVIGVSGFRGQVGRFVLDVLERWGLPVQEMSPRELRRLPDLRGLSTRKIYLVKLDYQDLYRLKPTVAPTGKSMRAMIKNCQGHLLESNLEYFFPKLAMFVNCIVWNKECPRLLTNAYLKSFFDNKALHERPILPVIGDITCDPNGSIECCRDTYPDNPSYIWQPLHNEEPILPEFDLKALEGESELFDLSRDGFAVMAVTNLPCEIPREASLMFSHNFCKKRPDLQDKSYLEWLAEARFEDDLENTDMPQALKNAIIVYKGKFNLQNPQLLVKDICIAMIRHNIIDAHQVLQYLA